MKYQFIEENRDEHEVALLCKILRVSRSAYYSWKKREASPRDLWRQELTDKIIELYSLNKQRYGAPRVHRLLIKEGYRVSLNTVAAIMSRNRLFAVKKRKFKVTTDSDHGMETFPNLLKPRGRSRTFVDFRDDLS